MSNSSININIQSDQKAVMEIGLNALDKQPKVDSGLKYKKAMFLGYYGNALRHLGKLAQAIEHYDMAYSLHDEINSTHGKTKNLIRKGTAHRLQGDVRTAHDFFTKARSNLEESTPELKILCLGELATIYRNIGRYNTAIPLYENSLEIARTKNDQVSEGYRLGNLGLTYIYLGDLSKGIAYNKEGLKLARSIGNRRGEGRRLGNLGLAYLDQNKLEIARNHFDEALAIADIEQDIRNRELQLGNLGYERFIQGDYPTAIELYEQALEIADAMDPKAAIRYRGNLGLIYSEISEVDKAIRYLETVWKQQQKYSFWDSIEEQFPEWNAEAEQYEKNILKYRQMGEVQGSRNYAVFPR